MHSTSNPATIMHRAFGALTLVARSLLQPLLQPLLQHPLLLPLPTGCLASR